MMKLAALLTFSCMCFLSPAVSAGDGTAVGVKPDATSRLGSAEKILVVGADVSVGERIVTGPTGNVQLLFADQTRLVVGPRSSLEIETYLLNGNSADKFAVNALAGTFRFISGNSPKSAYSIDTPTASIAVRGTKFDLTVGGGQTLVMLYEGALSICQGSTCVELDNRCDIGALGSLLTGAFRWTDGERSDLLGNFPLPNIQAAFLHSFRIAGAQACKSPPPGGTGNSMIETLPGQAIQNQTQICTPSSNDC